MIASFSVMVSSGGPLAGGNQGRFLSLAAHPPGRTSGLAIPAVSLPRFCYCRVMTIGITGPGPNAPRRSALAGLIIAAIVGAICLILLGHASDILVDWLWFSSIGYPSVFL